MYRPRRKISELRGCGSVGTRPICPDGVPKVTGAARYRNDHSPPGITCGKFLRSPLAHGHIVRIDTSEAEAPCGVYSLVTGADFPDFSFEYTGIERLQRNLWHDVRNMLAKEKAYYDSHPVAAVAARDEATPKAALALIDIEYESLPHVISRDEAIAVNAPVVHEDMYMRELTPKPAKPSNITRRWEPHPGEIEAGFAQADEIVEMNFDSPPVHQGYVEPPVLVAGYEADRNAPLWVSSQGHFQMRNLRAQFTGISPGRGEHGLGAPHMRQHRIGA